MTIEHDGAPTPLRVAIRNLHQGQVIEMTVAGSWSEPQLEARLGSLIGVRQPAEIQLRLPALGRTAPPDLVVARGLLAEIGGRLSVVLTDGDGGDDPLASGARGDAPLTRS